MTDAKKQGPIRVAQWATGTVGSAAMRAIIGHPDMELVAVKVYSESKEGKDAGEIAGVAPTGVKATRDIDAIIAAKPDIVVYMPESTDFDDVVKLLENGINISSTRGDFFHRNFLPDGVYERIEAACAKGNSSISTSGSSPGFITEALPIVVLSLARRLDLLSIDEYADCIEGCSEEMLLGIMGFGKAPEDFQRLSHPERDYVFGHSLTALADSLGIMLDRIEVTSEMAVCKEDTKLHVTTIPAGSVGGQRMVATGYQGDKPIMRFRCNWVVTRNLEPAWDLRDNGWRVLVEGDTPFDISISFPIAKENLAATLPNLTAHRPVNAIPYIVAARPGLLTTADLPQVIARLA